MKAPAARGGAQHGIRHLGAQEAHQLEAQPRRRQMRLRVDLADHLRGLRGVFALGERGEGAPRIRAKGVARRRLQPARREQAAQAAESGEQRDEWLQALKEGRWQSFY